MIAQATVLDDLRSIVGDRHAYPPEDSRPFAVDGVTPQAVVEPGTYDEVAAVMRYASRADLAVIPGVPSFLMMVGNIPDRYDIAICLDRLSDVIEYEPADQTVTCQAGMTVDDLQRTLAANGQMVPFGLRAPAPHSVGALVAANFSTLRLAYGAPRDFTIGMRVVTADGRITKAGGKVVKNVAGYDLCKLYTGSRGTLGIIVETTFKLVPLPQMTDHLALAFSRLPDACQLAATAYKHRLSLSAVDMRRDEKEDNKGAPGSAWVLRFDMAGSVAGVKRTRRELERLAHAFDSQVYKRPARQWSGGSFYAGQGNRLACQISVLPTQLAGLIETVDRDAPGASLQSISPIEGIIQVAWQDAGSDEGLVRMLRHLVARAGGSLTVTACSTELKQRIDVFGDPPAAFELMRRVKQQFDPKAILSPGRFVGRL